MLDNRNVPLTTMTPKRHLRRPTLIAAGLVAILATGVIVYSSESVRDSDGDGLTDLSERTGLLSDEGRMYFTDPLEGDTDGDGLSDHQEIGKRARSDDGTRVYLVLSDPTKTDSDDDSLTDAREQRGWIGHQGKRFNSDPLLFDSDGDGLPDGLEAGQLVAQRGGRVVFSTFSDPMRPDSDGDGLSDLEEADLSVDPLGSDSDADGLLDYEEVHVFGTAADLADTDGDTFDDQVEVDDTGAQGLDPLRPDAMTSAAAYATEFAAGALAGEFIPGDSAAWLAGNLISGTWAFGIADVRDFVAASIRADWISASYSAIGLVPATGDAVSTSLKISRFLVKNPHLVAEVCQLVLKVEWLDDSAKIKLIAETAPQAWHALSQSSSAHTLLTLAKYGTDLRSLADNLARTNHVDGQPAPFLASPVLAEQELKAMLRPDSSRAASSTKAFSTVGCGGTCNLTARSVDTLTDGIAHEAKLGYVRLTPSVEKQIRSDAYLIKEGEIDGAHWHFFASSRTNSIGASTAVLDLLDDLDIAYSTHLPE